MLSVPFPPPVATSEIMYGRKSAFPVPKPTSHAVVSPPTVIEQPVKVSEVSSPGSGSPSVAVVLPSSEESQSTVPRLVANFDASVTLAHVAVPLFVSPAKTVPDEYVFAAEQTASFALHNLVVAAVALEVPASAVNAIATIIAIPRILCCLISCSLVFGTNSAAARCDVREPF
jgi:hypothetical protein